MIKNFKFDGVKNWKQKISALSVYVKIFALVALIFFVFGVFTLGSFNGTGKSATVPYSTQSISMAYRLNYEENQTLSDVYINVGAVYAEPGASKSTATAQVRVNYYDGEDWLHSHGSAAYIANIYAVDKSDSYKSNANYNWISLATGGSITREYFRVTFTANRASAQVNEVVFLDGQGNRIKTTVASEFCEGISAAEVAKTLDAQGSFHASDSYRYNFSYNEEYILESINGIELGAEGNEKNTYVMSTDYNSFGILIYALSTWIFGKSTFGLRLPSFLATFGLFVLLFFFGRQLFKSDKWGLVLSSLFGLGGLFFTVGRMGTPMAVMLFAVVASVYFMYQFFAKGIDSARPVKTALPVLFSVLCMGAAFAVNSLAVFPCILSLILFALGVVRLYKHRAYLIIKAEQSPVSEVITEEGEERVESEETEEENAAETAIRSIHSEHKYKLRLSVGFAALGLVASLLLLVLASIPTYTSFVRSYGVADFFSAFGKGIAQCFSIGDITPYTADNAITPFDWFIALKGATVFDRSVMGEAATVLQVNVHANIAVVGFAALAFLFCTVYVITRFALRQTEDKKFKTVLRVYVGLLVGMAAGLVPYLFMPEASALQSYTFNLFYASFVALEFFILEGYKTANRKVFGGKVKAIDAALVVVFALIAVIFILTAPMCFGWEVSKIAADVTFNWMALLSNGRYGLINLG